VLCYIVMRCAVLSVRGPLQQECRSAEAAVGPVVRSAAGREGPSSRARLKAACSLDPCLPACPPACPPVCRVKGDPFVVIEYDNKQVGWDGMWWVGGVAWRGATVLAGG